MREQINCRHCYRLKYTSALSGALSGRRPFAIPGSEPHYAPDRPFRLDHILIDVQVEPSLKTLRGTATQKIRTVAPGQKQIRLDQIGISVEEVKINGKQVTWNTGDKDLVIELGGLGASGQTFAPGESFELAVRYTVSNPRRGLYFTGPDADHPKKPWQVWSQGQDEDNRWWIPTLDYPNQKATSEIIATVPKGYTAVANGALLSKKDEATTTRFHYKLGMPHVTYLISLVVAEFSQWEDKGPGGLPVQYFVAPGREEDGKRAFGNTPRMIEEYAAKIGVPYAYEKYSQVAVQDFIFGGMENTSATTQTDRTLHDARAHLDISSDPLVSHELAHQWFGDLLTCRDWSHGWLNEGFATFMERVWIEANTVDYGSAEKALDEAKYYSWMDLTEYRAEDEKSYRRPIVCNTYVEPIDLFDTHLYQKGGLVLNLLRAQLGDELFWESISHYVMTHRGQSVETIDLIRAIEDVTGRNMRRFFDEWVFGAGYPEFELSYAFDDEKKTVEVGIEQKQTGGKPQVTEGGATTHLFHLPAVVELTLEDGRILRQSVELADAKERVFVRVDAKPVMVRFDPGNTIPKTLKFPRPKAMLLHQLAKDPDCMGRIEAAHELGKIADNSIVKALGQALVSESFWGVQTEFAEVLGSIRMEESVDALVTAAGIPHPKARRAVAQALGTFKSPKAADATRKMAQKDSSYLVEATATFSYACARALPGQSGTDSRVDETEQFLITQLAKDSHLDVIRAHALKGFGQLPGIGRGERPKAMAALVDWTRRGKSQDARLAAIGVLGQIAKTAVHSERTRILDLFTHLAEEDDFRLRMRLVHALGDTESPDAIPVLHMIRAHDSDGRVKRDAYTTASALVTAGSTPESLAGLKTAYEKLEEEQRKLRSAVEEMRARTPL